jgi:hypothetical protein
MQMNEILVVVIGMLASLQCAAEGRLTPDVAAKVEQEVGETLPQIPQPITALAMKMLAQNQPVPDEACNIVQERMGGTES